MKKIIVLFLVITQISCNEKEKYSNQKVCSLLSKMYEEDQKTRNLPEFIQYSLEFSEMLDSIKLKKNLTDKQFNSLEIDDIEKALKRLKESVRYDKKPKSDVFSITI
jgi:superfamily II RNA helicase